MKMAVDFLNKGAKGFYLIVFLLSVEIKIILCQVASPVVVTKYGPIVGRLEFSFGGRPYSVFQGIPYAKPPIGSLRFKEPLEPDPWVEARPAIIPGSPCIQYVPIPNVTIQGSEDCLTLNVYSPNVSPTANLPVLALIHGGAFLFGESSGMNPRFIMDRDVVVVAMNYRLGPLGFLSTQDDVVPGNNGLKDQLLSFKWIKENIKSFGGNPDSVTIGGSSAGAASVLYHYLSQSSQGYFKQGFAMSGTALSEWTIQRSARDKANTLARYVGCPTKYSEIMVECLRNVPAAILVRGQEAIFEWTQNLFTPFRPVVESPYTSDPFLKDDPYVLLKNGYIKHAPLLFSINDNEGLLPSAAYLRERSTLPDLDRNFKRLASYVFEYNNTLPFELRAETAAKIRAFYLRNKPINRKTFPALVNALGDRMFKAPIATTALLYSSITSQPVHVYKFNFRGNYSLSDTLSLSTRNLGVSHADDLLHFIQMAPFIPTRADDIMMFPVIVNIVVSFAYTGIPEVSGVNWRPVQPHTDNLHFLDIGSPTDFSNQIASDPGNRKFWNSLGLLENENLYDFLKHNYESTYSGHYHGSYA